MPKHELRQNARQLRKNATKEENKLWYQFLRTFPVKFKRQHIIGQYITDFFCPAAGLVIELDGSQHFEEENLEYDRVRTQYLEDMRGFTVLRFSNLNVQENFEGVCTAIERAVVRLAPSSAPYGGTFPPKGKVFRGAFHENCYHLYRRSLLRQSRSRRLGRYSHVWRA